MPSNIEPNTREEIRQLLQNINDAWLKGRWQELADYFHEDIVIIQPGCQGREEGKQACVESYQEFTRQATIWEYKELEPAIDIWGDTAVASYRFEIAYELDGTAYHDVGHDLFVFVREKGHWYAVWRTLILPPSGQ